MMMMSHRSISFYEIEIVSFLDDIPRNMTRPTYDPYITYFMAQIPSPGTFRVKRIN